MASGKFSDTVRQQIRDRAVGRCEKCGLYVDYGAQYHHRRPRGMGGTSRKEIGGPQNGMYVHSGCHVIIESGRTRARLMGWLVPNGMNPESVPVRLWNGWFILTADGLRLPVAEPDETPDR
jgi:5-methylcytosine-specific restriction protein A